MGVGGQLVKRPWGSEVIIGNDGSEATWDNDRVGNSPDEEMEAQTRGTPGHTCWDNDKPEGSRSVCVHL